MLHWLPVRQRLTAPVLLLMLPPLLLRVLLGLLLLWWRLCRLQRGLRCMLLGLPGACGLHSRPRGLLSRWLHGDGLRWLRLLRHWWRGWWRRRRQWHL